MVFRIDLDGCELHSKLGGGIPFNSIVLIEAPNGLGKSALAQRFTYGAVKNGHSVSFVSSELPLTGFINQMNSLSYDIRQELITQKIKFVSLFPVIGNAKFRDNLIQKVISAKKLFESDLIFFDTLSELLIKDDMNLEECYDLISFFKKIAGQKKSLIFTVDPQMVNEKLFTLLKTVSDVYFRLEEKDQYGNKIKILKVERFNGASADVTEEVPYRVKAGIGIVVEIAS